MAKEEEIHQKECRDAYAQKEADEEEEEIGSCLEETGDRYANRLRKKGYPSF